MILKIPFPPFLPTIVFKKTSHQSQFHIRPLPSVTNVCYSAFSFYLCSEILEHRYPVFCDIPSSTFLKPAWLHPIHIKFTSNPDVLRNRKAVFCPSPFQQSSVGEHTVSVLGIHLRTENFAMQGVCGPQEPRHHHLESRLLHIFRTRTQVAWKRSMKWTLTHHLKYGSGNIQGSGRYLVFIKGHYLWGAKTKYFKHSLIWFL